MNREGQEQETFASQYPPRVSRWNSMETNHVWTIYFNN